ALADVVGAAAGIHYLGLDLVSASSVATGLGMSRGEHGVVPIPAPAVLELLIGVPVHTGGVPHELCTPTGAAILAATVSRWGDMPAMVVERVGVGAGGRDLAELPNVLRLVVGEQDRAESSVTPATVIEANVDDLDPRLWPTVIEALMAAGASDAWLTPIQMKKGRPAVTVSVLCGDDRTPALRDLLFRHTSTIGVREHAVSKRALDREIVTVSLAPGVEVRVKVARIGEDRVNAVPEYDDVVAAAAVLGVPAKSVLAHAAALAAGMPDSARA
ncbi:MAG: LarC family nickel insertion protein, partial [Mycobacteriales bacterium]